jgi:hypothetical protein
MLGFIYRLMRDFEKTHGMLPNMLYISPFHQKHLKAAFDSDFSMQQISSLLCMEMVINNDVMHPHVAWQQTGQYRRAS